MLKKEKIREYFWLAFIFALLHITGNPFCYSDRNTNIALVCTAMIFLLSKKRKLSIRTVKYLLLYAGLIGTTMLLNLDSSVTSYIHLYIHILGAVLLSECIEFERFSLYYIKVMAFLAAISLLVWTAYSINPSIVNRFPHQIIPYENDVRSYVNGYYLYTFFVNIGYGTGAASILKRNTGIFWEPGVFQYFLLLALLFLLNISDDKIQEQRPQDHNRKKMLIFLFLTLAIASTGSTTGLVCLIIIIFGYRKEVLRLLPNWLHNSNNVLGIVGIVISMALLLTSDLAIEAFSKFNSESYDVFKRIGLSVLRDYFSGSDFRPMFGIGVSKIVEYGYHSDSTIMYCLITLGSTFVLALLIQLLKTCKNLFTHPYYAFLFFVLGFSSEVWILKFFVLSIVFFRKGSNSKIY